MATLSATTMWYALTDYREQLIRLNIKYPGHYGNEQTIADIDNAILAISGNITSVQVIPNTCRM
jgi:hypothetical protein